MTTEYTPTPRGEALVPKNITQPPPPPNHKTTASPTTTTTAAATTVAVTSQTEARAATPDQDTSLLPPVTAPPSHPIINPSEPGVIDGRSILEVDMDALSEKPWRRPGTDISDYFNYGFDEISWEAYCYRRRDMTEMANQLKGAVTVCYYYIYYIYLSKVEILIDSFLSYSRALPDCLKIKLLHFPQKFVQWSWLAQQL